VELRGSGALAINLVWDMIEEHKKLGYGRDEGGMVFREEEGGERLGGYGGGGGYGGIGESGRRGKEGVGAGAGGKGDQKGVSFLASCWRPLAHRFSRLFQIIPPSRLKGCRPHSHAPFSYRELIAEFLLRGNGPYGLFGMSGAVIRIYDLFNRCGITLQPSFLDKIDQHGNDNTSIKLKYHLDVRPIYEKIRMLDTDLDFSYREETRCAVHFLLLTMVSADAKLHHEQILFKKFLHQVGLAPYQCPYFLFPIYT
jgi:hypothetical protein